MRSSGSAAKVAVPAIMAALSVVISYLGAIAPSGSWGIIAVAGLMPVAVVISLGIKAGFATWAAAAILDFVLLPTKFCAMLYAVLFGLYPLIKALIERLRRRPLEYLLKLVFFNLALSLLYFVMRAAVLDSLPSVFSRLEILYLAGNIVFLVYDFGLSKLIGFYIARVHRAVK